MTFGPKLTDLNSSLKERQLRTGFFWGRVYNASAMKTSNLQTDN